MEIVNSIDMKKAKTILTIALACCAMSAFAQKSDPVGTLVYSLPSTTLNFEVEAVCENFYAGPYAKYASKYLGVDVRTEDETNYQLSSVKMTPYVEADHSTRFSLAANKEIEASFLKMSATGLVSISDGAFGEESIWRFPKAVRGDFADKGVNSNLTSTETTLYRNVKGESEYNKVAVQQSLIVEKSLEKRAAETADMIFELRKKRVQIVTGDTDATYSGEAMASAIEEITRLEKEYMSMFTGYSVFQDQKMVFDVVPEAGREGQKYVAFRISDSAGLVSADNVSGKPILLEIVPQDIKPAQAAPSGKGNMIYYRIPAVCAVKLLNGSQVILQARVPVYQLGTLSTLPVAVSIK